MYCSIMTSVVDAPLSPNKQTNKQTISAAVYRRCTDTALGSLEIEKSRVCHVAVIPLA